MFPLCILVKIKVNNKVHMILIQNIRNTSETPGQIDLRTAFFLKNKNLFRLRKSTCKTQLLPRKNGL